MKRVLLVNWDGYPNIAHGGVYTWEKSLVEELSDWKFFVYNQLSNSNTNGAFRVPRNVVNSLSPPHFGATRVEEFTGKPFMGKVLATTPRAIERYFVPRFSQFVSKLISADCQPSGLSESVVQLHKFFKRFDYKKCVEDPLAWEQFLRLLQRDPLYRQMSLNEALRAYQMTQRVMQTLSTELPKVDLIHCALAWIPSLIGVIGKVENGTPVVVTEHGVAFRELLLYYNGYTYDEASKVMMKVMAANIVKTIYSAADVVTPVCSANTVWERYLGLPPEKIMIIYNGIDTKRFRPISVERKTDRPVVVFVGRIEIFKDLVSLIVAMNHVKLQIPDVLCLIYGEATDLEYARTCVETVRELGLKDTIRFMGKTDQPEMAYNIGDVVALSSLTEAFPYAAIEAMACGKPVVATDVGGTSEALEGCGILVPSRNSTELARAIVNLLKNSQLRAQLGEAAIKRVKEKFELSASANQYRLLYERLLGPSSTDSSPAPADRELVIAQ